MTQPSLEERLRSATRGRFEVLGILGRGGMASVFRARDLTLGREVALKVLSDDVLSDDSAVERFLEEARAVAALDHPSIAKVFSVEQRNGLYYLVLQLVHGQSLSEILKRGRLLDVGMVQMWFGQIADAVDYSHRCGIVHRDIKPGNVLIRDTGEAVLTDFGIAKAAAGPSLTRTGFLVGTPDYMSPEQCSADPTKVRPASDQYSLGVVLYEALSGTNPFSGHGNHMVAVSKQMETVPPALGEIRPEVPAELSDAVQRMLSKAPRDRFDSVSAAAQAAGCGASMGRRRVLSTPWEAQGAAVEGGSEPVPVTTQITRLVRTRWAWLLIPIGGWALVSLPSRFSGAVNEEGPSDSVVAAAPEEAVDSPVSAPPDESADPPAPGPTTSRPLEGVPTGPAPRRAPTAPPGASGVFVLGQGNELFTALSFASPLDGDHWCAGLELSVNGAPPREVSRTELRTMDAAQARLVTSLDSLAAAEDGPVAAVEAVGLVRMWQGSCPPAGSMPRPAFTVDLAPLCAQRMLSGTWFPCR